MGQSRNEDILQNMLGASNEIKPPQSRVEKLLQELSGQMPEANPSEGTTTGTLERLKIGDDIYSVEGGGSGTSDYDALNNKPQIAGTTLSGNKSLADLGIASATTVSGILDGASIDSFADVETALAGKQDALTFDDTPTANSNNPVKSGGVYSALSSKANASDVKNEFGGTLDQWNALTTAEKKEYDTYDITDDYSDGNYIYLPTIYSEEEREVGVWKNGKPLYQKSIPLTSSLSNDSWNNEFLGTKGSGISIKNFCGLVYGNGTPNLQFPINYYRSTTEYVSCITNDDGDDLNILASLHDLGTLYIKHITIQYTKTTDTAGSGTWTPTGQYAHHYSTDEQIIGTWIDGSTLYERTITGFSVTLQSGSVKDTEVNISYVSKLISVNALANDDVSVIPVAGYKISNTLQMLGFMNGNVINKAVIQYTKTA